MLPPESDPRWAKLVKGEIEHKFTTASVGMLLFRVRSAYKRDNSPEALRGYGGEMRSFFERFQGVLKDDIKAIF